MLVAIHMSIPIVAAHTESDIRRGVAEHFGVDVGTLEFEDATEDPDYPAYKCHVSRIEDPVFVYRTRVIA